MINIGIVGGNGKLGKSIVQLARKDIDISNVVVIGNKQELIRAENICDVYIECTTAKVFMSQLGLYRDLAKPIVIATTGFSEEELKLIKENLLGIPVIMSPNFSIGVYNYIKIVKYASSLVGDEFDISILERHHKFKKDKPSGTANKIAEIISEVNNQKNIEIQSVRSGNIVGEHEVLFANTESERIQISHSIFSRESFAKGAIVASKWLITKENNFYSMQDMME